MTQLLAKTFGLECLNGALLTFSAQSKIYRLFGSNAVQIRSDDAVSDFRR